MKRWLPLALLLIIPTTVRAEIQTKTIDYSHGDTQLEGFLAYDDKIEGARPGVVIVHEWMGLGPYVEKRARQLAELGYIAFAIDMYGKGVRPKDQNEAAALAGIYKDNRPLMRERANAGLDTLRQHPLSDDARIAAIGYCFGGTTVLEMARSGADLRGVVSFHGGLSTPDPNGASDIRGKVLALHGADDPYVSSAEVEEFEQEMRRGHVDWQLITYGGAVHGFTNEDNGTDNSKGAAYNAAADRRSWQAMKQFLAEVFGARTE